jgi:hypothetical protein
MVAQKASKQILNSSMARDTGRPSKMSGTWTIPNPMEVTKKVHFARNQPAGGSAEGSRTTAFGGA